MGRKKRCPYCRNATTTPRVRRPDETRNPPVRQDSRQRQHREKLDHGVKPAVGDDGVLICLHVLAVDLLELLPAAPLTVEQLQHRHAGDVFLEVGVDPGDGHPNSPVTLGHRPPKNQGDDDHERHGGQHDGGEQRAHLEHHRHDQAEHQHVAQDGDQARGKQVVQNVDVRGDARHHASDGVVIVEAQLQALKMREEFLAQVVHDALPHQLHREGLREFQEKGEENGRQEEREGDLQDSLERVGTQVACQEGRKLGCGGGVEVAVNLDLEQIRRHRLEEAVEDNGDQRQQHPRPVGPQVGEEPPHQPRVVSFPQDFFFVETVSHWSVVSGQLSVVSGRSNGPRTRDNGQSLRFLLELLLDQLLGVKIRVMPIQGQELFVPAALRDFSVVQHHDFVRVANGGDAVGYQQRRAPGHHFGQVAQNLLFRVGVHTRKCVIEN